MQRALSYRPCAGNMCANAVHGIGDPTWQTRSISCKIAYQESICYSRSSIGNLILRSAPSVQAWHALGSIKQTRELGGMVIKPCSNCLFSCFPNFQIVNFSIFFPILPLFFQISKFTLRSYTSSFFFFLTVQHRAGKICKFVRL